MNNQEYTQAAEWYNVDYCIEEFENKTISHKVVKSNSTESVYVTYYHGDKECKVRFSNHSCNALKFGDVLNGALTSKNEILYHLGLVKREKVITIEFGDIFEIGTDRLEFLNDEFEIIRLNHRITKKGRPMSEIRRKNKEKITYIYR